MGRDYAARNKRPSPRAAGLPGWVWLVAGLSMGLVVACIVYIGRPAQPMPMTPAGVAAQAAAKPRPKVEIPPKEEPRFDFYTLLEDETVVGGDTRATRPLRPATPQAPRPPAEPAPAMAPVAPGPAPAPAVNGGSERYLVLAGSFRDKGNAEAHKAKLAMSGVEARIESVTLQDGSLLHRVRVGPTPSLAQAERTVGALKSNGFDGRVIRAP
jgi:cell division protein FtsN